MLMSCFIVVTLVFCSNIGRFYFDNTDTPLKRSPLPLYGYLLVFRLKYSWKSPYWIKSRKTISQIKEKSKIRPKRIAHDGFTIFFTAYLLPNLMSTVFEEYHLQIHLFWFSSCFLYLILIFCLWQKIKLLNAFCFSVLFWFFSLFFGNELLVPQM